MPGGAIVEGVQGRYFLPLAVAGAALLPAPVAETVLFSVIVPATVCRTIGPAAEVVKDGDDAVVRLELPGVDVEKDVNVEVDKGRLVIHGEHRDEHAEEQNGRTLREIRYGSFRRSFQLPAHVTGEAIAASYDAGVLTVRVTGAYAGTQAQRIAITK